MTEDSRPSLEPALLDDFYTECDELFGQMRTCLVALEQFGSRPAAETAATIETLYRCVHSFKGNCGIVGLRLAEQLAHATEDILRRLVRHETAITAVAVDLVGRSIHRLEQIAAAHRAHQPLPPIEDLLPQAAADPGAAPVSPLRSAPAANVATHANWRATFAPAPTLDHRGVNVTSIRTRLAALGKIAKAAPIVRGDGTMVFEFSLTLAAPPAPADLEAWSADGVVFEPIAQESAPASAPADLASPLSLAPSHLVRVDLGRLDDLMRIMGELVIHRSRLDERIARLDGDRAPLQEVNAALARSLRDLRAAITRVRLVPIAEIFTRLPYVVRDLERESGKSVRLVVEGEGTEIDKYLVERLKEPLLHLVRNAVSHGIESPAERRAAHKPEQATLTLRAFSAGQTVTIEIRDDGRGLQARQILDRAAALGVAVPDSPTDADLLALICQPGFSTRVQADHAAGRGVGMSVVQTTVRELGGLLSVESVAGRFTQFTLRLPLTLSIADTFIVSAGSQTCAVPQSFVEEVVQFEEDDVRTVKQTEVIPYRDGVLPIVRLARLLGVEKRAHARIPVLVIGSERGSTGLVVDRVHAQREVVVRPMPDLLLKVRGISGATELGDGRPVLILDPAAITSGVVRPPALATPA